MISLQNPGEPERSTANRSPFSRASDWLMRLRSLDGFLYTPGGQQTLFSTCFGILTLEGTQNMAKLDPHSRDEIIARIQSYQQHETGLFIDTALTDHPLNTDAPHDLPYVTHQMTYFALHALDVLGARARIH
jgi:hypothetical protein